MPEKQEANAPSQPHEGLPLLHKRRQVRDGAGGRGWQWDVGEGWGARQPAMPGPGGFSGAEPVPGWPRPARPPQQYPRGREQLGTELCLAVAARSCLDAGAELASTAGTAVPTQPPLSRASSFSPQVPRRQPQAAPQHSWTTISSLHGDMPLLPGPASSQSTWSLCTRVGSSRETGPNAFLTRGGADGKAGGTGGDRWDRPPSKLRPPCRAWQAAPWTW